MKVYHTTSAPASLSHIIRYFLLVSAEIMLTIVVLLFSTMSVQSAPGWPDFGELVTNIVSQALFFV